VGPLTHSSIIRSSSRATYSNWSFCASLLLFFFFLSFFFFFFIYLFFPLLFPSFVLSTPSAFCSLSLPIPLTSTRVPVAIMSHAVVRPIRQLCFSSLPRHLRSLAYIDFAVALESLLPRTSSAWKFASHPSSSLHHLPTSRALSIIYSLGLRFTCF
jgi:hypothetical protein